MAVVPASGAQTGWQVTTADDTVETYTLAGQLTSVTTRAGLTTTLAYDASGHLATVTGPFGHRLGFSYDSNGRVSQMTAPDGGAFAYGYDAKGNLISVTHPDRSVRKYVYENKDFPNALTGVVDENGARFATWAYDSLGRATSSQHAGGAELTTLVYNSDGSATVTDARGYTHTDSFVTQFGLIKPAALAGAPVMNAGGKAFAYDSNGFVASRTDWNGAVTTYTHDARGNETSRTDASGTPLAHTITRTWRPDFHLATQIVDGNRTTSYAYDAHGNLTKKTVTAPGTNSAWSYTYNSAGQVLTAVDPLGHTTGYAYDSKGDLTAITNALGRTTKFTAYDANGRPLGFTDPNGLVTTLAYNFRGQVTSRTEGQEVTTYSYDPVGQLTGVKRPDGSALTFAYDAAHRLTGVADGLGNRIVLTLDAASNVTKRQVFNSANALVRTQSYGYDSVNRLARAIGALGQTTSFAHDPNGNLTGVTDPLGNVANMAFDALNRETSATLPAAGTTAFGYDSLDRLTGVTDARGLKTQTTWDGLDDPTALASPDTGGTAKTYDAAGNLRTTKDARGATAIYAYDWLNRVTKVAHSDGATILYAWDQGTNGVGHLTGMSDATGTTAWAYDLHGRVIARRQTTGDVALTTARAYDARTGRLTSLKYPSGLTLAFAYDGDGRVTGISRVASGGNVAIVSKGAWQPFGPVSAWTTGAGARYSRTFDGDGRVSAIAMPAGVTETIAYDKAGRVTGIAETGTATMSFAYDAAGRILGASAGADGQTFAYDLVGNRLSLVQTGSKPLSLTYAYAATSNRLVSIAGDAPATFPYDAAGNMLSHRYGYALGYDARGRMTSESLGAFAFTYGVNGLGQRVSKTGGVPAAPEYSVYDDDGRLLGQYGAGGAVIEETVWLDGLPVATVQPGGTFFIAPDHLGAPHQITNAAGAVVWRWDHDPFGQTAPTAKTGFRYDLRFPGQVYDAETGLNYNYFRDYNPALGRYVESDPIGLASGVNTYGYVNASPALASDSGGLYQDPMVSNADRAANLNDGSLVQQQQTWEEINRHLDETIYHVRVDIAHYLDNAALQAAIAGELMSRTPIAGFGKLVTAGAACEATAATILNPDFSDILQNSAWSAIAKQFKLESWEETLKFTFRNVILSKPAY